MQSPKCLQRLQRMSTITMLMLLSSPTSLVPRECTPLTWRTSSNSRWRRTTRICSSNSRLVRSIQAFLLLATGCQPSINLPHRGPLVSVFLVLLCVLDFSTLFPLSGAHSLFPCVSDWAVVSLPPFCPDSSALCSLSFPVVRYPTNMCQPNRQKNPAINKLKRNWLEDAVQPLVWTRKLTVASSPFFRFSSPRRRWRWAVFLVHYLLVIVFCFFSLESIYWCRHQWSSFICLFPIFSSIWWSIRCF